MRKNRRGREETMERDGWVEERERERERERNKKNYINANGLSSKYHTTPKYSKSPPFSYPFLM